MYTSPREPVYIYIYMYIRDLGEGRGGGVRVCLLCIRVQPRHRAYTNIGDRGGRGGIGIPPTDRARQTMDV